MLEEAKLNRILCCSVAKLCLTLCSPMDCSTPGSSVHGISQTRILEWVVISSSRGSSWPRDQTRASFTYRQILYHYATREALHPTLSWPGRALRDTPVCPERWGLPWLAGTDKEHNENTLCLSHCHWGLLCGCARLHQNSPKCCFRTQIVSASNCHHWGEEG